MLTLSHDDRSRRSASVAIVCLVAIGLGLRCYHYFRQPAIWHDEAALIVNVLDKTYVEQLGPLYWAEAAPPAFMWLEKACVQVLGDELWVLRLPPFIASGLALILFAWVVRSQLSPMAGVIATALFATSDSLFWHCCEAKPYAIDVLVATLAISFHQWRADRTMSAWLAVVVTPILIFLSFPAVFVIGGLLVARSQSLGRLQWNKAWLAHSVWAMVLAMSFLALLFGPIQQQRCEAMDSCWNNMMADWSRPLSVPWWAATHLFEACRYCFPPVGQPLLLFAAVGAITLWRKQHHDWVTVALLPLGLAFLASLLRRYPIGGSRVIVFATPGLALLIGVGVDTVWKRFAQLARWPLVATACIVATTPAFAIWTFINPWQHPDCTAAADWLRQRVQPGDTVIINHWEYAYLLRNTGADLKLLSDGAKIHNPPHVSNIAYVHTGVGPHWLAIIAYKPPEQSAFDRAAAEIGVTTTIAFDRAKVYRLATRVEARGAD